jgi:hypothetical protein
MVDVCHGELELTQKQGSKPVRHGLTPKPYYLCETLCYSAFPIGLLDFLFFRMVAISSGAAGQGHDRIDREAATFNLIAPIRTRSMSGG